MAKASYTHLTVIGAGYVGGTFLMASRQSCPDLRLRAVDVAEEPLQYLLKSDLVDDVSRTLPTTFDGEAHLVVVATPMTVMDEVFEHLATVTKSGGQNITVTDTGAVKRRVCERGQKHLGEGFIGGHPVLSRHHSGVNHAHSLLMAGKPYILCPADEDNPRLAALKTFLSEALSVNGQQMSPDDHDRHMAIASHLPQLWRLAYANFLYRNRPGEVLRVGGDALEDTLEGAGEAGAFWREVLMENRDFIEGALVSVQTMLGEASRALEGPEALAPWFERARELTGQMRRFGQVSP